MNWSNSKYSKTIYIPPSKYGTYVIADNKNNIKIISKKTSSSTNPLMNRYSNSAYSMKPKTKAYLNYNDDILLSYNYRISTKPNGNSTKEDYNRQMSYKPVQKTSYEPFTPLNSKKINTFNRVMYLPTPKTIPKSEEISVRTKIVSPSTFKTNLNSNKYSRSDDSGT